MPVTKIKLMTTKNKNKNAYRPLQRLPLSASGGWGEYTSGPGGYSLLTVMVIDFIPAN